MPSILFHNLRLLDPRRDELLDNMQVLVEDNIVREVSDRPITGIGPDRIDLGGRTLMPGLIDATFTSF